MSINWARDRAVQRAGIILQALTDAADKGEVCPDNRTLAKLVGYADPSCASALVYRLEAWGLIEVEGRGYLRVITICATGAKTAVRSEKVGRAIVRDAAAIWGVRPAGIFGPDTIRTYAQPRFAAYLVSNEVGMKLAEIGRFMARDHSTVIYGTRMARQHEQRDPEYAARLNALRNLHRSAAA